MKKLILITTLINLYCIDALATPYVGLSLQSNGFTVDNVGDFTIPMDNIEYNDIQTHVSGLLGYKFEELLPYSISIEVNYLQNDNKIPLNYKVDYDDRFDSEIKFEIFSLNTIHYYDVSDTSSLIGILGLNHSTFKFTQGDLRDKESSYGLNLGVGLNYEFLSKRLVFRPKVIHYIFPNINPENVSVQEINSMTSITLDFIVQF